MIEIVEETGSTNADLLERLRKGEDIPEGYWLLAERQTGGRGRGGRGWESAATNLHASTVIRLRKHDHPAHTLSLTIGLAVYEQVCGAMFDYHRDKVALKWPNDVLIDGAKAAGILLERHEDTVVAGIGINLHSAPRIEDRKTTHLSQWNSKHEASQHHALKHLARCVENELDLWRNERTEQVINRWCAAAHPVGTILSVHDHEDHVATGEFAGLNADGALILRLPDGETRVIHAGDVMLEN
ncbi:biotin--[acetyl-CoA-carboxylase] ligase [Aurantiacibacter sp. D1-12]|uniref:biotin--[acetyl-CoA-carboxylase] ligase n=1 Tax=Aurantiacibacter sp. D1-12 TaxID=2993658 RepID=UPI00237CFBA8|nr:biotin--[acetyl-CoA-carboxylase] ligase [Aurantiacibacter sp. D1-12]MDE1466630.1 biotin--[acetyl-CoA-carboxylase] ligase [Aurantiacibacter sp. D1-12]